MSLKKVLLGAVAAAGLAGVAHAGPMTGDVQWSSNIAITSDYVFRGISQSDGDPAVQGGIETQLNDMWYAGLWGSSISSAADNSTEMRGYVGYNPEAWGWDWDLGAIYYFFPSSVADNDRVEIHAGANRDFGQVNLKGHIYYSPEFSAAIDDYFHYTIGAGMDLHENFRMSANVGYSDYDDGSAVEDYTNWNIGGTFDWMGLNFDVRYHDTDVDPETLTSDSRAVVTLSRGW